MSGDIATDIKNNESYIKDRRNPLTKDQERLKKLEFKKSNPLALPDQVYVLISNHKGVERTFYVGIAIRPNVRWAQHQRVARLGVNTLPEYEHMRFCGVENCRMQVVDPSGEFTEAEWAQILTEQGHVLLNVAGCVDVKRKRHERYKHQALLDGSAAPIVKCDAFKKLMGIKSPANNP